MAPAAFSTLWRPGFWGTRDFTTWPLGSFTEKSLPMPCGSYATIWMSYWSPKPYVANAWPDARATSTSTSSSPHTMTGPSGGTDAMNAANFSRISSRSR